MKKTLLTLAFSTLSLNSFAYEILSEKSVCFPEGSKCYFRDVTEGEMKAKEGHVSANVFNIKSKSNVLTTISAMHIFTIENESDEPRIYTISYSVSVDNQMASNHMQIKINPHEFFSRNYKSFFQDAKQQAGLYAIHASTEYNWINQDSAQAFSSGIWTVLE